MFPPHKAAVKIKCKNSANRHTHSHSKVVGTMITVTTWYDDDGYCSSTS